MTSLKSNQIIRADFVLAFDPSGAYDEGKGTTGWCVMHCKTNTVLEVGSIRALDYPTRMEYWDAHCQLIRECTKKYGMRLAVTAEDYILYKNKAESQINSSFETSRLLGVVEHYCWQYAIPFYIRKAVVVMQRWTDDILIYKHIIYRIASARFVKCRDTKCLCEHEVDAIRHATHYTFFENRADNIGC